MKGRFFLPALLQAAVLVLSSCSTTPSEPSGEIQVSLTGSLETANGTAGFTFEIFLDGFRWGGQHTDASGMSVNNLTYAQYPRPFGPGRHTLELRFTSQPGSPTTYVARGWVVKRLGPQNNAPPTSPEAASGSMRLLGQADLPDQTTPVATGEAIRWDFDI